MAKLCCLTWMSVPPLRKAAAPGLPDSDLGLSVYDAAYVELALRLKLPLASKDVPLREAARKRRVTVLPRG